jgi:hypothetical protein
MVEFRTIKQPASLAMRPFSLEEAQFFVMGEGVAAAVGMGLTGEPSQLDIWFADGRTFVVAVNGPASLNPFSLTGLIDPEDCKSVVRAALNKES